MKSLNNERGSLLIILIVAITVIGVLMAAFVSIVSSKHEGYSYLVNSQKANSAAKAGIEWAIRYASTGLDSASRSILVSNPTLNATRTIEANVTFTTAYDYATDLLTVEGNCYGIKETVTLSNFRNYLGYITLNVSLDPVITPAYRSTNKRYLDVPVNVNGTYSISSITITMNMPYTYLVSIRDPAGNIVLDVEDTGYFNYPRDCASFNAPCVYPGAALELPSGAVTFTNNFWMQTIKSNSISFTQGYYTFRFYNPYPWTPPQHIITFGFSNGATSTVRFFGS